MPTPTSSPAPPGSARLWQLAAHLGYGRGRPARAPQPAITPVTGAGGELKEVRVGVFGAGGHAKSAHLPNLRALPGVTIVAIADRDPALARAMAAECAPAGLLRSAASGTPPRSPQPEIHSLGRVEPSNLSQL